MTNFYLRFGLAAVCALVFFRAGRQERSWPLLWAALSVLASIVALFLNWEFIGLMAAQSVVVVGIVTFRAWHARMNSLQPAKSGVAGGPVAASGESPRADDGFKSRMQNRGR